MSPPRSRPTTFARRGPVGFLRLVAYFGVAYAGTNGGTYASGGTFTLGFAGQQTAQNEVQVLNVTGATGGGNDGSVFLRYGSVDVPLGWPLRYSHSPGEVIDTRDLDALARIVAVIAKNW